MCVGATVLKGAVDVPGPGELHNQQRDVVRHTLREESDARDFGCGTLRHLGYVPGSIYPDAAMTFQLTRSRERLAVLQLLLDHYPTAPREVLCLVEEYGYQVELDLSATEQVRSNSWHTTYDESRWNFHKAHDHDVLLTLTSGTQSIQIHTPEYSSLPQFGSITRRFVVIFTVSNAYVYHRETGNLLWLTDPEVEFGEDLYLRRAIGALELGRMETGEVTDRLIIDKTAPVLNMAIGNEDGYIWYMTTVSGQRYRIQDDKIVRGSCNNQIASHEFVNYGNIMNFRAAAILNQYAYVFDGHVLVQINEGRIAQSAYITKDHNQFMAVRLTASRRLLFSREGGRVHRTPPRALPNEDADRAIVDRFLLLERGLRAHRV